MVRIVTEARCRAQLVGGNDRVACEWLPTVWATDVEGIQCALGTIRASRSTVRASS